MVIPGVAAYMMLSPDEGRRIETGTRELFAPPALNSFGRRTPPAA